MGQLRVKRAWESAANIPALLQTSGVTLVRLSVISGPQFSIRMEENICFASHFCITLSSLPQQHWFAIAMCHMDAYCTCECRTQTLGLWWHLGIETLQKDKRIDSHCTLGKQMKINFKSSRKWRIVYIQERWSLDDLFLSRPNLLLFLPHLKKGSKLVC